MLRRFIFKSVALASPFLAAAAMIVVVDPYNFWRVIHVVPDDIKMKTSVALNPCIWRMLEYRRSPRPNILLGDSRMGALSQDEVSRVSEQPYANLYYGGASLNEMIDTFWYAASLTKLQNVYMGINFTLYNDYNYTARTETVRAMLENPLLYFTNRSVLKAAYYNTQMALGSADPRIGVPTVDRDRFWQQTLNSGYYRQYVYPVRYRKQLSSIADYCRNNSIRLHFIIFPQHVDMQARINHFHLQEEYGKYKRDLAEFGATYDYDYKNELTVKAEDYRDPIHFTPRVTSVLIREIWSGPMDIGQQIRRQATREGGAPLTPRVHIDGTSGFLALLGSFRRSLE
jgi:hypothetical protein